MRDSLWYRLKALANHVTDNEEVFNDVRRLRNLAAQGNLSDVDREVALETLDEFGY